MTCYFSQLLPPGTTCGSFSFHYKVFCPFVIILFFSEGGRSEVGLEMFTEVSFRARDPYTTLRSKVCSQDHMIECHGDNVILMHEVEHRT